MWCLSCLKPSTREDPYETELDLAKAVSSQHEADITSRSRLEEEQYALAIQESLNLAESSRRRQQEEEEKKRLAKELEDDAQVALALQYEDRERERQLDDKSALEAEEIEQLAKAIGESLKEENKRKQIEYEQVKKDEQIAKDLQNFLSEMASEERSRLHGVTVLDDEDKQIAKAVENSLKEENKRKQIEYEQGKKDEQIAKDLQNFLSEMANEERTRPHGETVLDDEDKQIAKAVENSLKEKRKGKQFEYEQGKKDAQESLNKVEPPSQLEENENISTRAPSDEDVQLGEALAKSLKDKGKGKQPKDEGEEDEKLPTVNPPLSMCGGCNFEIEHGKSVDVLGVPWHPECLWCDACHKLIAIHEAEIIVSNSRGKFHKSCYERYCYVCKEKKMKKYNHHPFWEERYCPAHESDGTHKCCSCERLEPKGANYVMLGDRRWLCLECMESAVMDTCEAQPLHFEIREFFEGLHMKIDKEFPFLLVEKQALNKAEKEEKIDYQYETVTRGICLSEAQTVTSVSKRPRMGPNKQLIGMRTESQEVVRECEVTAVLILYGFPRVLTGYILAHEMMHAYLRLSGHRIINNVLEEGICQVLGHMWLESQRYSPVEAEASSSASVSRTPAAACASKKGECSDFEKKLVEFCKNQIETDDSPDYGVGFRKVNEMVSESSLQATLKAIIRKG